MKWAVAYVFPQVDPRKYIPAAKEFSVSYQKYPNATPHSLYVVVNGQHDSVGHGHFPDETQFLESNNYAKDLGAFMVAAHQIDCDMLVCLGAHVRFVKPGWLDRIAQVIKRTGPTLCGPWAFQVITPHLRTTFFACPPQLLKCYPHDVIDRYGFEHGPHNISLWTREVGFEPLQITWSHVLLLNEWQPMEIKESLARDQHTRRDYLE